MDTTTIPGLLDAMELFVAGGRKIDSDVSLTFEQKRDKLTTLNLKLGLG